MKRFQLSGGPWCEDEQNHSKKSSRCMSLKYQRIEYASLDNCESESCFAIGKSPMILNFGIESRMFELRKQSLEADVQAWCYRHSWKRKRSDNADLRSDIRREATKSPTIARVKTYSTTCRDLQKYLADSKQLELLRKTEKIYVRSWLFQVHVGGWYGFGRDGNIPNTIRQSWYESGKIQCWPHWKLNVHFCRRSAIYEANQAAKK